jgi:4-hydroxybutyryl-CoA dehydratase/vinylacetyl-CoA-Delta-isomerase
MHRGGSPEGAKLMIRLNTGLEDSVGYAKRLIGLEEDVLEPVKK